MEELHVINASKRTLFFRKGEYIFRQSQRPSGLYILSSGKVKNVSVNDNGSEQIFSLNRPVDFLGLADFTNNSAHTWSSVALEDVTICFIPRDVIFHVMSGNAGFSIKLLQYVSAIHSDTIRREANLRSKHMRGRMAYTLLYLCQLFDCEQTGSMLDLSLKRSDFAALANMNTGNAIRVLSEFSKEGYITLSPEGIHFHNIKALLNMSLLH
jgi:CRP/FNR family transcriptional regulator